MTENFGSSPSGVPWNKSCFKQGRLSSERGEPVFSNPWDKDTHAFESWIAGWKDNERKKEGNYEL